MTTEENRISSYEHILEENDDWICIENKCIDHLDSASEDEDEQWNDWNEKEFEIEDENDYINDENENESTQHNENLNDDNENDENDNQQQLESQSSLDILITPSSFFRPNSTVETTQSSQRADPMEIECD